jgi:hypothetical protein
MMDDDDMMNYFITDFMADKEQRYVMMTGSCIDSCSANRIKQPFSILKKMKLKSAPPSGRRVELMGERFNAFGCRYFRQVLTLVRSDCVHGGRGTQKTSVTAGGTRGWNNKVGGFLCFGTEWPQPWQSD